MPRLSVLPLARRGLLWSPPDLIGREIEAEIAAISAELAEKEKKFLKAACRADGQTEWRGAPRNAE